MMIPYFCTSLLENLHLELSSGILHLWNLLICPNRSPTKVLLCCISIARVKGEAAGGLTINKYAVNTLQLCCHMRGTLDSIDYSNANQC